MTEDHEKFEVLEELEDMIVARAGTTSQNTVLLELDVDTCWWLVYCLQDADPEENVSIKLASFMDKHFNQEEEEE